MFKLVTKSIFKFKCPFQPLLRSPIPNINSSERGLKNKTKIVHKVFTKKKKKKILQVCLEPLVSDYIGIHFNLRGLIHYKKNPRKSLS